MNPIYVLDACALIAVLANETGVAVVRDILQKAADGEAKVIMHSVNFLEVYYDTYRAHDERAALKLVRDLRVSPLHIEIEISTQMIIIAGKLKATYKMSLADAIGLALTATVNGAFVSPTITNWTRLSATKRSNSCGFVNTFSVLDYPAN